MPNKDPVEIKNRLMQEYKNKKHPQFSTWEAGKTYSSAVGSVKVLSIDDDGMPIVEMISGK